jgi:hypothetical protein
MYGRAQGVHHRAIRLRERYAGVVCKESLLLGGDDACMPERCKVTAQVGLIEVQDVFKITDAQSPFMEQIQYAESVRVCQGLQHL